jgi:hypothetical protein
MREKTSPCRNGGFKICIGSGRAICENQSESGIRCYIELGNYVWISGSIPLLHIFTINLLENNMEPALVIVLLLSAILVLWMFGATPDPDLITNIVTAVPLSK